jgi:hypothetical protein
MSYSGISLVVHLCLLPLLLFSGEHKTCRFFSLKRRSYVYKPPVRQITACSHYGRSQELMKYVPFK